MTSLTACGNRTRIEYKFVPPPEGLIQDCPATPVALVVNGDLAKAILAGRLDLALCNADKAGLRAWVKDMSK